MTGGNLQKGFHIWSGEKGEKHVRTRKRVQKTKKGSKQSLKDMGTPESQGSEVNQTSNLREFAGFPEIL